MKNPEFTKNLWLEFTVQRVGMGVVILGLIFAILYLMDSPSSLFNEARIMGILICGLWGTKTVADSVSDEIRERTWPFIKLSSISPLQLMLGKIFGATSYVWFLTAICLFVGYINCPDMIPMWTEDHQVDKNMYFIFCIFLGITMQVAAYLMSIKAINPQMHYQKTNSLVIAAIIIILAGNYYFIFHEASLGIIQWYHLSIYSAGFYIINLFVILTWLFIGSYNLTKAELGYKISNVSWIGFLLFIAFYVNGFDNIFIQTKMLQIHFVTLIFTIFAFVYYLVLLTEQKDIVTLHKTIANMRSSPLRGFITVYPIWFVTFVFELVMMLGILVSYPSQGYIYLSMLFLMIRDGAIILYCCSSGKRRGEITAIMYLMILYILIPMILKIAFGSSVKVYFYPQVEATFISTLVIALQAAVMSMLTFSKVKNLGLKVS